MQSQIFNKLQLHFRIYGSGGSPGKSAPYPLVFLHGLMGYASNWGKIWPQFAAERAVLVLDQRGHGKSEKPQHGYSPQHYASDLLHLMDELGWEKAHIVGHSMGGRVAMHFARSFPERCASLILEDSGAEARPNRIQWIRKLLASIPTPFPDRESAKKFFDTNFAGDPLLGGFLFANIERNAAEKFDWRFLPSAMEETIALGRAKDDLELFAAILAQTLIIRGERSDEFPQEEAERMVQQKQNARLVVVSGAGHFVHPTHPVEFCSALREFIVEVEAASTP